MVTQPCRYNVDWPWHFKFHQSSLSSSCTSWIHYETNKNVQILPQWTTTIFYYFLLAVGYRTLISCLLHKICLETGHEIGVHWTLNLVLLYSVQWISQQEFTGKSFYFIMYISLIYFFWPESQPGLVWNI